MIALPAFVGGMLAGACLMALWQTMGEMDDQGDPLPRDVQDEEDSR